MQKDTKLQDCTIQFNENNIIIPEHIDITGEVDKLLLIIAEAEDKVAVMRKYYVKNKADKLYCDKYVHNCGTNTTP